MPTQILLVQVTVILLAAATLSWFARRIGQPGVVGEMAAGIVLGPSLLGWIAPGFHTAVFAPDRLVQLDVLSQFGLILFIYMVGLRIEISHCRQIGKVALIVSNTGIFVSFALGALLGIWLYSDVDAPNKSLPAFVLFMGTAMSITALPVLARILDERGMLGSPMGNIAIACAAVGDVTAWFLLTAVVALVRLGQLGHSSWIGFLLFGGYCAIMAFLVRRFLGERRLLLLPLIILSAAVAEWSGLHAMIGALAVGLVTPRSLADKLTEQLEPVTLTLLLPITFALTGLRTDLRILSQSGAFLDVCLIFAVAIGGKWGGTRLGTFAAGLDKQSGSILGVLMNTRGLMELVVLNIGLEQGILSRSVFSMMVLMALGTTLMTGPLLLLAQRSDTGRGRLPRVSRTESDDFSRAVR